ncbi:MAG TPA: hypothetical protein P5558_19860 [Geminicoccaceae bacterium]|nr:hypothetical protein [Geminicoccaceae bacterium]
MLQQNWRDRLGPAAFGADGRLVDWRSGLLPCLRGLRTAEAMRLFDPVRLRQPESAAAMALNSFLVWRERPRDLRLGERNGFTELRFAARCPTGVRGTPPYLDLIAANGEALVTVTARGPEYLARKPSRLARAYADISLPEAMQGWQALLQDLLDEPGRFRHVDAASLVKNAIGIFRTFPGHRATLLYLFWEPESAEALDFHRHRVELQTILQQVDGSAVTLQAQSFAELWHDWERRFDTPWLRAMVAELRERYAVATPPLSAL